MKQTVGILFGVAVSALCFWYSARNADWSEVKAGFATANYWTLPAILLLTFGFYWLKAQRWAMLLRPVMALSGKALFPPVMSGFAANNLLPAHLGELVRVAVVRQQFQVPVAAGLSTVVLERLFDVLAILLLFAAGLMVHRRSGGELPLRGVGWPGWLLWARCSAPPFICAGPTRWCVCLRPPRAARPGLPGALTAAVLNLLRQGADGLAALKKRPRGSADRGKLAGPMGNELHDRLCGAGGVRYSGHGGDRVRGHRGHRFCRYGAVDAGLLRRDPDRVSG